MLTAKYGFSLVFRHIQIPQLPQGLQIMADQGFPNIARLLLPVGPHGQEMRGIMKEHFKNCRTLIERCFGILKSSYTCVVTRRFRSRRWIAPLICNLSAAMFNRRRKMMIMLWESLDIF